MTFANVLLAVIAQVAVALLLYLLITRMAKADDAVLDRMYQNTRAIYAGVAERFSLRLIDTAPVADAIGRVPNFPRLEGTVDNYHIVISTGELQSGFIDTPASCIQIDLLKGAPRPQVSGPASNTVPAPEAGSGFDRLKATGNKRLSIRKLTRDTIPTAAGRQAFSRLKANRSDVAYVNDTLWVMVPEEWNLSLPAEVALYIRRLFRRDTHKAEGDSPMMYPLETALLDAVALAESLTTDLKTGP